VFDDVLAAVPEACPVEAAVMDKAYDSDEIRGNLQEKDIKPVIPTKSNRVKQIPHDKKLYRRRNCVERLVGRLKQFRAVATRYDKLACTFLAAIHLVAAFVMVR
jgi:transposase